MTPEMRATRLGCLTSSMAAVIMGGLKTEGLAEYVDALAFERRFGDAEEEGYQSRAMLRGQEMEPRALEWYEFAEDCLLLPKDPKTGGTFTHPVYPFVKATPDGMRPGICVEAKSLLKKAWMACEATRRIPPVYYWQTRWQPWTLGIDRCDFVVWHPKATGFVIPVELSPGDVEQMTARACLVNAMVEQRVDELRERFG